MAENRKQIDTIIVLRNDKTTVWAESTKILERGELGVGYTDDGKVIVKAGNGTSTWKDLPQVEGVFENNLTLTYAFGKYAPDATGSFELKTAGKTMSEVMLDAFAQEVYEGLILSRPSASFSVSGTKTAEVGETFNNPVATLDLTATGSYKYKAKDADGNEEQADIKFTEASIKYNGSAVASLDANNPNADLTYTLEIPEADRVLGDTAKSYKFTAIAKYGADANRPLTNLGNFVAKDSEGNYYGTKAFDDAIGQIAAGTALSSTDKTATMTGYRKMFMGTTNEANPTVDSAFIRGLNTVSEKAAKATKDVNAVAGNTAIYWAWPTSLTTATPTFQYFFMGAWQSLDGPAKVADDIMVEGANGYSSVKYTVYKYSPNSGVFEGDMQTRIKIN